MPLNPEYVLAPSLQEYFVDKDTGLPLANGYIKFYIDNTSIFKPVFEIVAAGNDFTYTQLPNPVTLSAVGTFADYNGVDILPYYFPFDSDGNVQLYKVEVYSEGGVLQFTRVGWPNTFIPIVLAGADVTNFVPNGQFLLHNNVPASSSNNFIAGQVNDGTTIIAQGGWFYYRNGTNYVDNVTFPRYNSPVGEPTGNPRYAIQIARSVVGSSGSRNDLTLQFPNVNTFSSSILKYNFYFEGMSISGSNIPVQIIVHKNFGTGGSPSLETFTIIDTIVLTSAETTKFTLPVSFGSNELFNLGTNDDDYVEIILRFPINSTQVAKLTDFAITVGNEVLQSFPQQTEAQQIGPSTAGWLPEPDPDGFDLYLPAILTKSGMTFDHSEIGDVVAAGNASNFDGSISFNSNRLLADGAQYRYNDYSPLGIPYARLGDFYIAGGTSGVPQFGTGANFVTLALEADGSTPANKVIFSFNKIQVPVYPANGTPSPGLTFFNFIATVTGFNYVAYGNGGDLVTAISTVVNQNTPASSGTSGLVVSNIINAPFNYSAFTVTTNTASFLSAGSGNPGKYFLFSSDIINYYLWFKVNGETDPAVGGRTGIQLNLDPLMDANDVAFVLANALSGFQISRIAFPVGSAVPNGSFFSFTTNSQIYYAYYIVNGVDIPPAVSTQIVIPIRINSSDTSTLVASKTQSALNTFYFAVPDNRGLFLRGNDPNGSWDIDFARRFSVSNELVGAFPGTLELYQVQNHNHSSSSSLTIINSRDGANVAPAVGSDPLFAAGTQLTGSKTYTVASTVDYNGGSETRPTNISVVWAIKY